MKNIWKLWAKSLGEKASDDAKEADAIAIFRSLIVLANFVTCFFIVSGIIHHW